VYARATTHRASPEHVDEAIVHYQDGIPSFSEIAGNRGAFLLVDRSAGKAISVTLWESEEVMRRADELRQPPAQESLGESVDEYEVAVWAVS
jgi:heme-degrading monooxygenase HmoA